MAHVNVLHGPQIVKRKNVRVSMHNEVLSYMAE